MAFATRCTHSVRPVKPCVTRARVPATQHRSRLVVRAESAQSGLGGLRSYLSGAIASIFGRFEDANAPDWSKSASTFDGRITHDDHARLRKLYEVVQHVRGCTDPNALNYNPSADLDDGSCAYTPGTAGEAAEQKGVGEYLQSAVTRLFDHNFKGDSTEPKWEITPFSGRIMSQREINDMLRFEKVLRKTLDETKPSQE